MSGNFTWCHGIWLHSVHHWFQQLLSLVYITFTVTDLIYTAFHCQWLCFSSGWKLPLLHNLTSVPMLHNMDARYMSEMCMPIATSACRRGLRSATSSDSTCQTYDVWLSCFQCCRPSLLEWSTRLSQVTGSFILLFQTSTQDITILCILGRIRYFSVLETAVNYAV